MLGDSTFPLVTVVLPLRNEAKHVKRSLASVFAQDYPAGRLEILVVDGMSSDGTRELVREMGAQTRYPVSLLNNPALIASAALNKGIGVAKGEIIIRVDGHCSVAKDYVRKCVEHIQSDGVDGVGGPMASIGETRIARATALGMSSQFGVGNSGFRTMAGRSMLTDTVPFAAYTRRLIERVGCYDEELACDEDDEYNYRVREMGGKLLLAADVHSEYYSRSSFRQLWRQYFQYGYWKVRVLQKHPRQMQTRQFIPPLLVAALLGSLLLGALVPAALSVFLLVGGSYVTANLSASVITAAKRGWGNVPLLPVTFAILHLSYGMGFLAGLVKFANRWGDRRGKVPEWPRAHVGV